MGNCCSIFKFNKFKNNRQVYAGLWKVFSPIAPSFCILHCHHDVVSSFTELGFCTRNITILLTGLDYAGKTTTAKRLVGEPVDGVLKTVGFSLVKLRHHKYNVNIYDLGGSSQIRAIWSKYYMDAHGVIYVVDASDIGRLHESKLLFVELLSHENVSGKPILLLANKQDNKNAVDELDLVDQMNVEYVVNKYRCPTRVEICSALSLFNGKIDPGIINGYRWLVDNIIENYKTINERVQRDMANYAALVQKDQEEWRRRIEEKHTDTPDDMFPITNGNPFKSIDSVIEAKDTEMLIKNGKHRNRNGQKGMCNNTETVENAPNGTASVHNKTDMSNVSGTLTGHSAGSLKETMREHKNKLMRRFGRNKKKFSRFNKTAPLTMDVLMKDAEANGVSSAHSGRIETKQINPRRRPLTAPSTMRSPKGSAWDLDAPLDISISTSSRVFIVNKEVSESEETVSYF